MKLKLFILRLMGIKHGPWMIPVHDYWIFIDTYQQIWEIRYTGQHEIPLQIYLRER